MNLAKLEQKIRKKTTIDPLTDCWLWQGALTKAGYGLLQVDSIMHYVHRASAMIYLNYNPLNKDVQINHVDKICPNRNCWNPDHLYIGTKADNIHDAQEKGTFRPIKTHCKRGHEFTNENTYIDPDGNQNCRICHYESVKLHREKNGK